MSAVFSRPANRTQDTGRSTQYAGEDRAQDVKRVCHCEDPGSRRWRDRRGRGNLILRDRFARGSARDDKILIQTFSWILNIVFWINNNGPHRNVTRSFFRIWNLESLSTVALCEGGWNLIYSVTVNSRMSITESSLLSTTSTFQSPDQRGSMFLELHVRQFGPPTFSLGSAIAVPL